MSNEVDPPSVESSTPTTAGSVAPQAPAGAVHLVQFDTATGAVTDRGQIGTAAGYLDGGGGLTFDSSGNLYAYMVAEDAQCQVGGPISRGRLVQSIDFAADGTLWAVGSVTPLGLGESDRAQLSTLSTSTGAQTMGQLLSSDTRTVVFGLAIANPSCPVEIQPNFTG